MSNIVVNMCFWSLCIPLCHGWLNIEREQKVFVSLITSFHCALLLSPPSTQKTLQRFRSWPNTSLMSFWLRKTLKSRNYNRRIKVKKKKNTILLIVWLVFHILLPFMTLSAELWLSLEEHQYALELIMGRYRKQMLQLMMAKKELDTKPVLSLHEDHAKVRRLSSYFFQNSQSFVG